MALINTINDCINKYGQMDIERCKQIIILETQNEIEAINNNPYLSNYEKSIHVQQIEQIKNTLMAEQYKREAFLKVADILNKLSKSFENQNK